MRMRWATGQFLLALDTVTAPVPVVGECNAGGSFGRSVADVTRARYLDSRR